MVDRERFRFGNRGLAQSQVIERPVSGVCVCGSAAVVEKAGRTVCRTCADALKGREYPLRNGWQRSSWGSFTEEFQLDMMHRPMRPREKMY